MKLTRRLDAITGWIDRERVADIGTDHGLVPFFLWEKGCPKVIATDISAPSLNKSRELCRNTDVEFRLGNGLQVLVVDEVDAVIVAGMGGILMVELLEAAKEVVKALDFLILQPMQASEQLRAYLYSAYRILDEKIVYEDGRYFEMMKVTYTGEPTTVDAIDYLLPKVALLRGDGDALAFLDHLIEKKRGIVTQIGDTDSGRERKATLQHEIERLEAWTRQNL
ncbi:class I SAM-dependent methyltransferase [Peptoniphilus equinus]|uniref:Class I SAM-dependent methyltransferase n=1 Tax=Peptoniphilus equinus TaxID=3016343 RepID=A0ABY7QUD6_9FIRM|nr:class I SAM-dependent methyltransferase [Peptoniphilus equinus]WBW50388.1 class I SAM-dependent methyltransferase [Peptoniphilus equinus]